jgi:hypothetical protein
MRLRLLQVDFELVLRRPIEPAAAIGNYGSKENAPAEQLKLS